MINFRISQNNPRKLNLFRTKIKTSTKNASVESKDTKPLSQQTSGLKILNLNIMNSEQQDLKSTPRFASPRKKADYLLNPEKPKRADFRPHRKLSYRPLSNNQKVLRQTNTPFIKKNKKMPAVFLRPIESSNNTSRHQNLQYQSVDHSVKNKSGTEKERQMMRILYEIRPEVVRDQKTVNQPPFYQVRLPLKSPVPQLMR